MALGIEAGNQAVRQEVSKGSFQEVNIRAVCEKVRAEGMNVISNYIFGFPDDTLETMEETLDLALELNTEMANMYPCQAFQEVRCITWPDTRVEVAGELWRVRVSVLR